VQVEEFVALVRRFEAGGFVDFRGHCGILRVAGCGTGRWTLAWGLRVKKGHLGLFFQ
jgi:hypothetical protein